MTALGIRGYNYATGIKAQDHIVGFTASGT
jgi:hypothetical protein